jgi:NDP-sugar pyrophosphorylase family protein
VFGNATPLWKNLVFTEEQPQLLGSGGGIHNAEPDLKGRGTFLVMNGDEIILPHQMSTLNDMIDFHKWHKGIATLLTMEHPLVGKQFGGAWLDGKSEISQFSKTAIPGKRGLHFLGAMLFEEDIFKYFKSEVTDENILYETLTKAMQAGEKVHAFETKAQWFETGNSKDFLAAAEQILQTIQENPYNEKLEQPYWLDYLKQTIRLYSNNQFVIEQDWAKLDQLKKSIKEIKKGF